MLTRYAAFVIVSNLILPLSAQTQNALDFDGVDDQVTVANASTLIANQAGFSLTCWVYPTQSANWPNMEAIAGFRDNLDCDFYLLQTYGTTMEGRFRNSANQVVTLDSTAVLTLNTWQHVALTYDGTSLSMYRNGVLLGTIAASGSVTSTSEMFRIGNMPIPGSSQVFLDGMVDETTLWKRGLTQAEVQCIMDNGADPGDADLQLYYRMDQGIPAGANAGMTSLIDATGNQNGTLAGFALNGATSNYVAGSPNDGTVQATICAGESYDLNGMPLTQSGTYTATIPIGGGCDSVVVLDLTVIPVNTNVVQSTNLLIAQATGAGFQWINCTTNNPIPGATNQYYTAFTVGEYAVIVTQNGCSDTSACYDVTTIGMEERSMPDARIWPLPVTDRLNIELSAPLSDVEVRIADLTGRVVHQRSFPTLYRSVIEVQAMPTGVYFLELGSGSMRKALRFVRE